MAVNFRQASARDLDEIVLLVRRAINTMEINGIRQWDEFYPTREDFSEDINCGHLYVGDSGGKIAVIFTVNSSYDEEYSNGKWLRPNVDFRVIHRLCVDPAFQHMGIAKAALEYVEHSLKDMGVGAVRLDVFSENPYALKLYETMGYSTVGCARWRKGRFLLMEKYI